jgi:hypothetical protein
LPNDQKPRTVVDMLSPPCPKEALEGRFAALDLASPHFAEFQAFYDEQRALTRECGATPRPSERYAELVQLTSEERQLDGWRRWHQRCLAVDGAPRIVSRRVPCDTLVEWIERSRTWPALWVIELRFALGVFGVMDDHGNDIHHNGQLMASVERARETLYLPGSDGFVAVHIPYPLVYPFDVHPRIAPLVDLSARRAQDGTFCVANDLKSYYRDTLYVLQGREIVKVPVVRLTELQRSYVFTFFDRIKDLPGTDDDDDDDDRSGSMPAAGGAQWSLLIDGGEPIGSFFDGLLDVAADDAGWSYEERCDPRIFFEAVKRHQLHRAIRAYLADLRLDIRCAHMPSDSAIKAELGRLICEIREAGIVVRVAGQEITPDAIWAALEALRRAVSAVVCWPS